MKKSKVLAAALIGAVISMGAGYASWTDALSINNSVTTGNLDVDFVTPGPVAFNADNAGFAKGEVKAAENDATITLTNLYPGATATVTLPVKNNGSIPVKNGNFDFTGQPDWLTITPDPASQASTLAVGETKDVVVTMTVNDKAPNVLNTTQTFKATATYDQFNK